jgi:hypothetical protein
MEAISVVFMLDDSNVKKLVRRPVPGIEEGYQKVLALDSITFLNK